ncbi:MAG TPA: FAD-dependent oxidoreductase [Streptosporangiaceae bacterium]|jgi:predicted NAD/FAD-binding protein|nr:FAD-dependent oxidoreductase [Streptosporangiaceae bacterium]
MTGRRIAVVGGGVSGITAGYVLSRTDHVTLFEADDRLGGHADTHPTGVDTGFIVYNERTYPCSPGCSPNSGWLPSRPR